MNKLYLLPFFLILFVVFYVDANAQEWPEKTSAYDLSKQSHLGGTRIYTVNDTEVEGSPLLNEEFKKGRFLFTSGDQSEVVPINYDLERHLILYEEDGQTMILDNLNVKGFILGPPQNSNSWESTQEEYTFRVSNREFDFSEPTPVQVLYNQNGSVKLFALRKVKLVRGNRQDPFSGKTTHRYKSDTEYYLETPDNEMHKLRRLRAKEIIKALGDNSKKELKSYIDENDLDEKSERDLVRLLTYYDNEILAVNE